MGETHTGSLLMMTADVIRSDGMGVCVELGYKGTDKCS